MPVTMSQTRDCAPTLKSPSPILLPKFIAKDQLWKPCHFPYYIGSVWLCLAFKVFHDLGLLWFSSLPVPQELLQAQPPSKNLPRSSQCLSSSATGFLVLSYIYKLTHTLFLVWVLHACLRPSLMWDLPGSQDHSFLSFLYSQCPSCHCRVITHHT